MNQCSSRKQLTVREKEVLERLVSGDSSRSATKALGISERTLKFHISNLFRKLEVKNRAEAVAVVLSGEGLGRPSAGGGS